MVRDLTLHELKGAILIHDHVSSAAFIHGVVTYINVRVFYLLVTGHYTELGIVGLRLAKIPICSVIKSKVMDKVKGP